MWDGISLERIGAVSMIAGTLIGIFSLGWFALRLILVKIGRRKGSRLRTPLWLLLISLLMTSVPIAVNSALARFNTLGPLNKIVAGERHLTLTGWGRHDYSTIVAYPDTIVLQMANSDVTDETLSYLAEMNQLRELDLNNSLVTDVSLDAISKRPKLRDLRLARTKITDEGFRQHLMDKESLTKLDLTGTSVASKTVREWKAINPERKALK